MATKTAEPNAQLICEGVEDNRKLTQLADSIAKAVAATKAAQAKERELKAELVALVKPVWLNVNFQSNEPEHIFDVVGRTAVLQVDLMNKYQLKEDAIPKLKELLGAAARCIFEDHHSITVDLTGYSLGERSEVLRVIEDHACVPDDRITIENSKEVREDFHDRRHKLFIPAVNRRIDQLLPVHTQVTV